MADPGPVSNPGGLSWKRITIEGSVIILSILLAFAIDAGWDARQGSQKELVYLRALRGEMELAKAELDEDYGRRSHWFALIDSVLAEGDRRSAADEVVNAWIVQSTMGLARFFPPSSVLDDLVSSGNLALLTSNDLRFALLSYQRGRERVNFLGDWGLAGDEDGLRPYLTTHFRWTALTPRPIGADGMLPNERQEPVDVAPETLQRILDDPVFQNLLLIRRQRIGIVQRRSVQLGDLIAEVVAQIDRELARLGDDPPN